MPDIGYDRSRVTTLDGGIPDELRQDYLEISDSTPEEEIAQRAMDHVDIKSSEWHDIAKKSLAEVLGILELKEGDIIVYPWRGALAMYEATLDMDIPDRVQHIHFGLARDEENPEETAEIYLPFSEETLEKIQNTTGRIIIADPMLATGGSIKTVIDNINSKSVIDKSRFHVACLLAAPEGIQALQEEYSGMNIFTGVVDEKLDEKKFIVPGLGDFGDKWIAAMKDNPRALEKIRETLSSVEQKELDYRMKLAA